VSKSTFWDRDPDDLERYLLEQGRLDRAGDKARERTIAHATAIAMAGAGLAGTSVTTGAAAAASAAPWALVMKWVAVGVASGGLAVGAVEEWRYARPTEPAPSIAAVARATPSTGPSTPTGRVHARSNELENTAEPAPARLPIPLESNPSPAVTEASATISAENAEVARGNAKTHNEPSSSELAGARVANPVAGRREPNAAEAPAASLMLAPPPGLGLPPGATLQGELYLLDEARRSLEAHAGAQALAALDAYAQRYPSGGMRIEASALRIEALFALGQRDRAEALARAFLATHASSPAAMRVRWLIEKRGSASKP
jgi:TolA-binding protein